MMITLSENVIANRGLYQEEPFEFRNYNYKLNMYQDVMRACAMKTLFNIEVEELPEEDAKRAKGGKNKKHNQGNSTDSIIKTNILAKYKLEVQNFKADFELIFKDHKGMEWMLSQITQQFSKLTLLNYDQNKMLCMFYLFLNLINNLFEKNEKNEYEKIIINLFLSNNLFYKFIYDRFYKESSKDKKDKKHNKKTQDVATSEPGINLLLEDLKVIVDLINTTVLNTYPKIYDCVFNKYQELLVKTYFSEYNPFSSIKPFDHQQSFIEEAYISMRCDLPFLRIMRTPPGSGKSLLSVSLANMILKFNQFIEKDKTTKLEKQILIYCCYNHKVRLEVGKHCYNENIPLATVSNFTIIPSYNCFSDGRKGYYSKFKSQVAVSNNYKNMTNAEILEQEFRNLEKYCDKPPVLYISDIESARVLSQIVSNSVAYIDEPTVGLESDVTMDISVQYCNILTKLPKRAILLSATLPSIDKLAILQNKWMADMHLTTNEYEVDIKDPKKNIDFQVKYLYVKELSGGFDSIPILLMDQNMKLALPHLYLNGTKEEVVDALIRDFEGQRQYIKYYSAQVMYKIGHEFYNKQKQHELYIKKYFSYDMLKFSNMFQYYYKVLLDVKANAKHEQFFNIQFKINQDLETYKKSQFYEMELFTKFAHKLKGNTIVFSDTSDYINSFNDYLVNNDIEHSKTTSFLRKYIDHNLTLEKKSALETKDIKNEMVSMQKREDALSWENPNVWSKKAIINSEAHLAKHFSPDFSYSKYPEYYSYRKNNIESYFLCSDLNDIQSIVSTGILCGVGINMHIPEALHNSKQSDDYDNVVLDNAESGLLSYLVSDKSIIYGTNFIVNNLILDFKEFTKGVLIQSVGRAGRYGKTEFANVWMTTDQVKVLMNEEMKELDNLVKICTEILK